MRIKNTKGFSLIELIVVIAIIAILAVNLLPRYFSFTDGIRKNAAQAEAKNIWSIEQTEYAKYGCWPVIGTGTGPNDDSGNPQSTITLSDGTVYTLDGKLTPAAPPDGSFTYKKWNGTATTNLWIVDCDASGKMTEAHY